MGQGVRPRKFADAPTTRFPVHSRLPIVNDAATHPNEPPTVLRVEQLTKDYPATRALDGVSVDFRRGEVHGLIGENGAGKSTLMKALAGLVTPDAGTITRLGRPVEIRSVHDAARLGVAMVHQELNLIGELSVADNIFLGRERTALGFVKADDTRAEAKKLLDDIGCRVPVSAKVKSLSIADQQMVEIAKALSCEAEILILDEPTAVLSRREVDLLFALVRSLREAGRTIIYISHLLPEVLEICDRVTVLRDGKFVRTLDEAAMKQATEEQLASLMVGREMSDHFPTLAVPTDRVMLRVSDLHVPGRVHGATFAVRAGEILGFAGLVGAGRTELAEGLVGLRPHTAALVEVEGRSVQLKRVSDAVRAGIAYLSEDRKGRALTLGMDIASNTTLVSLKRYCHPFISKKEEEAAAQKQARALNTKLGGVRDAITTLSGGNQQKVALARWLEARPKVLILDEPTRGVDIGAKEEIYRLIAELAADGLACILISSEMNEIIGLCHRVAVMRAGRIVTVLERDELTEETIMFHAAGVTPAHRSPQQRSA